MKRLVLVSAAMLGLAVSMAGAGELDAEYGGKAKPAPANPAVARPSTELDAETPTQTCCFKRRFYAYGGYGGFGCGGFSYGGYGYGGGFCGIGYGGFGGYGGYGGFGYGGSGGYGFGGFGGYGGGLGYGGFGGYGGGFY